MKANTKKFIDQNIEALTYLSDSEIKTLLIKRFNENKTTEALNYIAALWFRRSYAFNSDEITSY